MPPYDLMSFYKSGADAAAEPSVAAAKMQQAELALKYQPQLAADAVTEANAKAQESQIKLAEMVKGAADEAAMQPLIKNYFSDPSNKDKPVSEIMTDIAKMKINTTGNIKDATKEITAAESAARAEAYVEEHKLKGAQNALEGAIDTVKGAKSAEDLPAMRALANTIKDAGTRQRFDAAIKSMESAQTPEEFNKARDNLDQYLLSAKERFTEKLKRDELTRKENADEKRFKAQEDAIAQRERAAAARQTGVDKQNKDYNEASRFIGGTYDKMFRDENYQKAKKDYEAIKDAGPSWWETTSHHQDKLDGAEKKLKSTESQYLKKIRSYYQGLDDGTKARVADQVTDPDMPEISFEEATGIKAKPDALVPSNTPQPTQAQGKGTVNSPVPVTSQAQAEALPKGSYFVLNGRRGHIE